MFTEHYITTNCTISKGIVSKDRGKLFENSNVQLFNFLTSVYQHFQLNYPRFYKMDLLSKLGWLASEIMLKDGFEKDAYRNEDIGLVLANTNSSLDNDIKYFNSIKDFPSPSLFVYTLPNIVIGEISIRNRFKGEHAFFVQKTFDAAFVEQQVCYLLNHNILQACICGWVEVLEQEYKAVLFLIEKKQKEKSVLFSAENMNSIFNNN